MCAAVHLLDWRIVAYEKNSNEIKSQIYFLPCFLRHRKENKLSTVLLIIHSDEILIFCHIKSTNYLITLTSYSDSESAKIIAALFAASFTKITVSL